MSLTLFAGTRNASSWAMRAWLALRAAGVEFEEVEVDIRRPQRLINLAAIGQISPPAMVPILVVDGETIFDSLAIMELANDRADGRLLPREIVDRARARSIVAWQHSGLSAICPRISFESAFYPFKRMLVADEIAQLPRLFDWLERLLVRSGGPFLFGAAGLADFALAPTVIRLVRHDPDLDAWPEAARWCQAMLGHELVAEWLREADRRPHIWFDDYLVGGQAPMLRPCKHVAAADIQARSEQVRAAAERCGSPR